MIKNQTEKQRLSAVWYSVVRRVFCRTCNHTQQWHHSLLNTPLRYTWRSKVKCLTAEDVTELNLYNENWDIRKINICYSPRALINVEGHLCYKCHKCISIICHNLYLTLTKFFECLNLTIKHWSCHRNAWVEKKTGFYRLDWEKLSCVNFYWYVQNQYIVIYINCHIVICYSDLRC